MHIAVPEIFECDVDARLKQDQHRQNQQESGKGYVDGYRADVHSWKK